MSHDSLSQCLEYPPTTSGSCHLVLSVRAYSPGIATALARFAGAQSKERKGSNFAGNTDVATNNVGLCFADCCLALAKNMLFRSPVKHTLNDVVGNVDK